MVYPNVPNWNNPMEDSKMLAISLTVLYIGFIAGMSVGIYYERKGGKKDLASALNQVQILNHRLSGGKN